MHLVYDRRQFFPSLKRNIKVPFERKGVFPTCDRLNKKKVRKERMEYCAFYYFTLKLIKYYFHLMEKKDGAFVPLLVSPLLDGLKFIDPEERGIPLLFLSLSSILVPNKQFYCLPSIPLFPFPLPQTRHSINGVTKYDTDEMVSMLLLGFE